MQIFKLTEAQRIENQAVIDAIKEFKERLTATKKLFNAEGDALSARSQAWWDEFAASNSLATDNGTSAEQCEVDGEVAIRVFDEEETKNRQEESVRKSLSEMLGSMAVELSQSDDGESSSGDAPKDDPAKVEETAAS